MKFITTIASSLAIAGCAHIPNVSVVSTSPRTVVIQSFIDFSGTQALASKECQKYGREARYSATIPGTIEYVFDCVQ